jgi:hypothetical protein
MTTSKKGVYIRLSADGRRQLDELRNKLDETQEGVIRLAIDRLYRETSITDDLKEIFTKGILIDGRCTIIEFGSEEDKFKEGDGVQ